MNAENFIYWLNGYFEIREATGASVTLDSGQVKVIRDHIALVMDKVTPTIKPQTTTAVWSPFIKGEYIKPSFEADQFGGFDRDKKIC